MVLSQILIEFVDGVKNAYRLREGKIEFRPANAVDQNSPWQALSESEILLHKNLGTIVAAWLENQNGNLWCENGRPSLPARRRTRKSV